MAASLIMSRRCALALANRGVALMARQSCIIEAMNKVDGHGGKLCNNNNIKLGSGFYCSSLHTVPLPLIYHEFKETRDIGELHRGSVPQIDYYGFKDARDGELHSDIAKMIDNELETDRRIVAPFTIHDIVEDEVPGYLSLKRNHDKEKITLHVCKNALECGEHDAVPLKIEIVKADGSSLNFSVEAETHALHITAGVLITSKDAKLDLPHCMEEYPKIKRYFIEYLDIRGINESLINKLRDHKDTIKTHKALLEWLKGFIKFMEA